MITTEKASANLKTLAQCVLAFFDLAILEGLRADVGALKEWTVFKGYLAASPLDLNGISKYLNELKNFKFMENLQKIPTFREVAARSKPIAYVDFRKQQVDTIVGLNCQQ